MTEHEKAMAEAIETLLLSDHMGDAHEAGLTLARALGGQALEDKYVAYVEGDHDVLKGDERFPILGETEET